MFDEKSALSARDAALTAGSNSVAPDPYGLDLNSDRHPDILWHDPTSRENFLWSMSGEKGAEHRASVTIDPMSGEWHIKSALDFNADGHQDLLWRNELTGQNEVWFMGGEQGDQRQGTDTLAGIGSDWDVGGAADFNHDGRGDLLWRNNGTGENEVWLMGGEKGTDILSKKAVKTLGYSWEIRGVADFNNDGHADILWRHNGQGKNALWLMGGENGTTMLDGKGLNDVGGDWNIHGAADFNRDGTPDIFWHNKATGKSALWYMTSTNGNEIKDGDVLPWVQKNWVPTVTGWGSQETASKVVKMPVKPTESSVPSSPLIEQPTKKDNGFNIQFDYRFDNLNWFDSQKRAVLEAAANIWENIIQDEFDNIKAGTTVHASSLTSGGFEAFKLDYEIDDMLVFAFANGMDGSGGQLAEAGATTYEGDRNTKSVFQPWLGEIEFDVTEPWYINANPDAAVNVPEAQFDLLSVAVHELGHILGISSSVSAFKALINDRREFTGKSATGINGGKAIPLDSKGSHIRDNFEVTGLGENALDPQLRKGTRKLLTALDVALLDDIGYTVNTSSLKPVPKLQVLSIAQGNQETTQLQAGGTYTLRWDDNFSEEVKIDLYEGSRYVRTINRSTSSNGSYSWEAPAELADGKYYRLKISSVEHSGIYSFSDRPFTIQSKSLLSGSTFNDSSLRIGNEYHLQWNDNLRETIQVELYKGDQYSRTITASTLSDGSYRWKVPSYIAKGSGYRLKLTSTADASIYDYTPIFTIHD